MGGPLTDAETRGRKEGVLVDTNLLLLLFVGAHDPAYISKFKRTNHYTTGDFESLLRFLARTRVISTPSILTEVSNLLGQVPHPGARLSVFTRFAESIRTLDEYHVPSRAVVESPLFSEFGLTDLTIVDLCRDKYLVLTDDARLASHLYRAGVLVMDFQRLRPRLDSWQR